MPLLKLITLALALLGSPIFVIISAFALISFYSIEVDSSVIIIEMSRLAETPLLLSLPLFIFDVSIPQQLVPCIIKRKFNPITSNLLKSMTFLIWRKEDYLLAWFMP